MFPSNRQVKGHPVINHVKNTIHSIKTRPRSLFSFRNKMASVMVTSCLTARIPSSLQRNTAIKHLKFGIISLNRQTRSLSSNKIIGRNVFRGFKETVGNTPLIKLEKLSAQTGCNIMVKAEFLNPGGSVKDGGALYLFKVAEVRGTMRFPLCPDTTHN